MMKICVAGSCNQSLVGGKSFNFEKEQTKLCKVEVKVSKTQSAAEL